MIRNRDFFVSVLIFLLLDAVAVVGAALVFGGCVWAYVLALAVLLTAVHLTLSRRRYRAIGRLSSELDSILHGNALLSDSEGTEGELAVLRSEIYKMTVKMREQAAQLQNDKLGLSDSMADVSHQLRTPLTSLNLAVTLLKSPDTTPERRAELLHDITRLLNRLDWLVSAMLIMAKIDAGTAKFKKKRVEVKELLSRAREPLEIPMELKSLELTVDMDGDESFLGDMEWSVEAVGNLLKNAMEHSPEGGRIHIACTENALFTELIISDDGPGIDKEDLPNLFRRFYRGKGSSEGSVGVGLALARMIALEQNGSLKAENSPYGGAKFTMRFYKITI